MVRFRPDADVSCERRALNSLLKVTDPALLVLGIQAVGDHQVDDLLLVVDVEDHLKWTGFAV